MSDERSIPPVEYRKILYTTDLSEAGRHAFPHAAGIAHRCRAGLTVLHVLESMEFEKYLVGYIGEDLWKEIKTRNLEEARDILIRRKRDNAAIRSEVDEHLQATMDGERGPYITYEVKVQLGDPAEEILREVEAGGYDLVVMGNHGRGMIGDVVMGSTAWKVLHRCRVPVLLVPVPPA